MFEIVFTIFFCLLTDQVIFSQNIFNFLDRQLCSKLFFEYINAFTFQFLIMIIIVLIVYYHPTIRSKYQTLGICNSSGTFYSFFFLQSTVLFDILVLKDPK